MGTRPTANQPYRAEGADLAAQSSDMAAKGDFLHGKLDETESLLRLENYYRDLAYGNSVTLQYYREQNADLFDAWEQTYHDKTYTLYTDSLSLDYALLSQLVSEYDTVAGYGDFLDSELKSIEETFNISLKFSAEDRDVLKEYIKDNGKEDLVAVIVQKIRGEI